MTALPRGYRYSSVYAGIRKTPQDDLALIVSEEPASAAGVFTRNRVQAAPVVLARNHLRDSAGRASAILVNAGNANCATQTGEAVARESCESLAALLGVTPAWVLPASTGVIGVELDGSKITRALPRLVDGLSPDRFDAVAGAILTTDTRPKVASVELSCGGGAVRIAGMTKGAGMIQPNMATTLAFVMTDAAIAPAALREALLEGVEHTYARISVDGDTSTNDTCIVLANGASGVRIDADDSAAFRDGLRRVLESLAIDIVRDGEGARKLITIDVSGAPDDGAAATVARSIANSPLVKTAIAGNDPNWGRILSAAGNSGVDFDPSAVRIELQGTQVCESGVAAEFNEADMKRRLDDPACLIRFEISGAGRGRARFWTCDFTERYVEINASYRT